MKKTLQFLVFFFSLTLCNGLKAQTMLQNWMTQSNNAAITNSDDRPYFSMVTSAGTIGIVGVANSKIVLATYDANGNDLWTNKYTSSSNDYPVALSQGPSGNYYFGAYLSAYIRKIGTVGNTSWGRTSTNSYFGYSLAVDANGDIYSLGADYQNNNIYIEKISTTGNLIWTKTYAGYFGFGGQPSKVLIDHAGNLLVAVNAKNSVGDWFLSVAKFDTVAANNAPVWQNAYTTTKGYVNDFILDNTTNASYITGYIDNGANLYDMVVYKSGPSGAINWSNGFHDPVINGNDAGYSLAEDNTGNIYVGMSSENASKQYAVRKYSNGGAFITTAVIPYNNYNTGLIEPRIRIHPSTNQLYLSGTIFTSPIDNMLALYKSNLGLTGFSLIYIYNPGPTENDYAIDIHVDPTTQDMLLTGNVYSTVNGNDYFYAKTDTVGNFVYSNIYNGIMNGIDYVSSVVTDASNLAAVAGGTNSTLTKLDGFIVKYDASGNEQWQGVFPGTGGFDDYLESAVINSSGHYYAAGYTSNSPSDKDMWVIKVDGNGSKLWNLTQAGSQSGGDDGIKELKVDNINNGYAVGHQTNSGTGKDAVIFKFNSSGTVLWSKKLTSAGNASDGFMTLAYTPAGLLYAAGYTTKPNGERDVLLAKYGTSGNLIWSTTYNSTQNGNDTAMAITFDNNNVYIVCRSDSAKSITLKYDQAGIFKWATAEPTMLGGVGPDIVCNSNGQVFIVCNNGGGQERVICYNNTGSEQWHKDYLYTCCDHPMKIRSTNHGTIIVALDYYGAIGAIELDTLGNQKNNIMLAAGPSADQGGTRALTIDGNGDVYVAGYFEQETGYDIYTLKLCYTPAPLAVSGNNSVCRGATGEIYSVVSNTTVTGYNWAYPAGASANGTSNNISVNFGTASSGYIIVQQTNYCGANDGDSLFVNVLPLPQVNGGADKNICPNTSITLTGSGALNYSWSGGAVDGVPFTPVVTQSFQVTGTDANGCSNKDTVMVLLKTPPPSSLCMVTVDSSSMHNILIWDKTSFTAVSYFNIYREDITNNYTLIAAVSFDSLSEYHDYDMSFANPNVTTKRYKITAVDTCGNEGPKSDFHNTIFISNNGSGTFTWNTYTIQNHPNPVTSYRLMRDDFATGNWQQVSTTAGTQNVLNDPSYSTFASTADWRVETIWGISCTATQRYGNNNTQTAVVKSKSNISNNRTTAVKNTETTFAVYPNPTGGNVTLDLSSITTGKINIKITSVIGEEVYNETLQQANGKHMIDLSKYQNGTYLVQITGTNTSVVKRIIKN